MTDTARRRDAGISLVPMTRTEVIALAAITLLGLLLRLYGAGRAMSMDELNNVWLATGERKLSLAVNALLYLPLIRLIHAIHASEFALRLPAILAGTATVPLLSWTGRRLFGAPVGLTVALLVAIAPMHVALSQLVHSYALFGLVALLALYLAWEAVDRGNAAAAYSLAIVLGAGMYLHLYIAFVALGCLMLILVWEVSCWRSRHPLPIRNGLRLRHFLTPAAISGILVLPLLYQWTSSLIFQLLEGAEDPEPGTIWAKEAKFSLSMLLFLRMYRQLFVWKSPCPRYFPVLVTSATLILVGGAFLFRKNRRATIAVSLWILVPIYPIALLSQAGGIDFGTRRFVFILPQLLLLVAGGLCAVAAGLRRLAGRLRLPPTHRGWRWLGPLLALGLGAVVSATALPRHYHDIEEAGYRLEARFLESVARPGDALLIWKPEYVDYYYRGAVPLVDARRLTMAQLQELAIGNRIFFVRPPRPELMVAIENWIREMPSLDFTYGKRSPVISFQIRRPGDPARLLAEQTEVLEKAVALKPKQWRLRRQLAEYYVKQGKEVEARDERRFVRTFREAAVCPF